ncbi:hypothetical protein H0B56_01425 [Haloechinothrix sp. YIM 98757]|uniref:Uncharacterized protein n=1 Tax=Haloechinothrix aidingensis TaxID=2752311 RepID=A0A838A7F1_9PSEU|nr:hypothetical protein [Haloechinothrix aidingensis]MBA0124199.1 hypothetical protein [Haloechinothrix aidingensis]
MRRLSGVTAAVLSVVALGILGSTAPAAASPVPAASSDGSLTCGYTVNSKAGTVSGSCSGTTSAGSASGSFTGHLRPGGLATGSFTLRTPLGELDGTFRGSPFGPGHGPPSKATGEWSVSGGTTQLSGTFVATLR